MHVKCWWNWPKGANLLPDIFMHLTSTSVKASHKTLMKLSPGFKIFNILIEIKYVCIPNLKQSKKV